MRHALNVALQGFEGGMVLVSHDRHLIKTAADSLWLVADGKLEVFDGDLDDYQEWLRSRGKPGPPRRARGSAPGAVLSASPRPRGRLSRLRREIGEIETRLAALAAERDRIETQLCQDPMHAGLQAQHADLTRAAAAMEARWLEVGMAIEAAQAETGSD